MQTLNHSVLIRYLNEPPPLASQARMRWDQLSAMPCSVARGLAVIGDRWTLMILRDCFLGVRRFDDFQQSLGISRTIVSDRLATLVSEGVLYRAPAGSAQHRREYRLTDKGLELYPVVMAIVGWGNRHYADENGPPVLHRHEVCGHDMTSMATCSHCHEPLDPRTVTVRTNPGIISKSR